MEKKIIAKRKKSFKEALAEIESRKDWGKGSWSLPRNATVAEKTKYELCEKILGYQEDNDLSDEAIARKLHLTIAELEDILFCRISKFNLDYLINLTNKLFSPAEVKITVEKNKIPDKRKKNAIHARVV